LLQTVSRGEEVVISFHGKPCAKLVPILAKHAKKSSGPGPGFGMWKDRKDMKDVNAYVRALREGRF
jgi:antitoxin (DNA-binding transcriptional repressor) of toxin-antitoxin stability system